MKIHLLLRVICVVLLLFYLPILAPPIFAQQVISCSGNSGTSATAQINYTIGETAIQSFVGSEAILTQGFHQGVIHITAIDLIDFPGIAVSVFPNPTTDLVTLKILNRGTGNYAYSVFDLSGKNLINKSFTNSETEISLGFLIPSTYLLRIYNENRELKIFKIVKTYK